MAVDQFKVLEIQHREIFDCYFLQDPPQTSELNFTNLFIWRHCYHPIWREWKQCLLVILKQEENPAFGLPPIGSGDKRQALDALFKALEAHSSEPKVSRAGEAFVRKWVDPSRYRVLFDRDNSDYVYLTQDLIRLPGKKYHRKKNHLNRFLKNCRFEYRQMDLGLVECFLDMQEKWCEIKNCANNQGLLSEDYAVYEALTHFEDLGYHGAAIEIDSKIEAFSLGEALNPTTAVIHMEKANPDIPDLYVAMNQMFCRHAWSGMEFINREQDLGIEGLRKAKESYYPHHMENKYIIFPKKT